MYSKELEGLITLIISAIFGIVAGYLAFSLLIPGIVIALWIAFGVGIGTLGILALLAIFTRGKDERCLCKIGPCLAISALGAVAASLIGLVITIIPGVLGTAILIGVAAFFLLNTLFNIVRLILCFVENECKCRK